LLLFLETIKKKPPKKGALKDSTLTKRCVTCTL